jgi:hypothetical protein
MCFVSAAIPAVVAVAGTLLGSALTYAFQRWSAAQQRSHEFGRQLRAERLTAYSGFVSVLTEFRRGEFSWFHRELDDPDGPIAAAAKAESFRLRGAALTSLAQVRLVAGDPDVVAAASVARGLSQKVRQGDKAGLDSRLDKAREALDAFVALAAAEVQAFPPGRRADRGQA